MVDARQAAESQYLNADYVNESASKRLVVLDAGDYEKTDFGTRLTLNIEIDGMKKIWRPNRDSVKNFISEHGYATNKWIGKPAGLQVVTVQGKQTVVAVPLQIPTPEENP